MAIDLYPHNKEAYEKAKICIRESGKAAIVHPTGTGKSYIAFAFIEENPNLQFLWLSPNDYIFSTQINNLKVQQHIQFQNITFHTYAWLMWNEDQIEELKPDFIILDEFHRAGALKWGESIKKLLEVYPAVKLLGLTATNVRYLDSQRDMADEIFGGEIASYMSLAEAMAKRILPLPKYVISMFSYREKINHYKNRISSMKNKLKQKDCETLLEKLRRKLENAVGVEQIFAKHIKNKTGKYIVFCANAEHMYEMIAQVPLWFCYVDRTPHVYHVYSHNPETEKDFQKFLKDNSPHLKLLFCIDMLNEGIHVENVDGVVLLRPTISPIVYKQQIGRALATGRKGTPLIFDMVNNFDSLYNIDSLKEDFDAMFLMYGRRNEAEGFNDEFEIVDELKECRDLFSQLQRNLDSSWDEYYRSLCIYKEFYGNIDVPRRYTDANHLYLGRWLERQKSFYREGQLPHEQVQKLEVLGCKWDRDLDRRFESMFQLLCDYKEKYGNVNVPPKFKTAQGESLGNWCSNLRARYRLGKIDEDRVRRLDEIGFIWQPYMSNWDECYAYAKAYYETNGDLKVPKRYMCEDGYKLGLWIYTQRRVREGAVKGNISEEQIKRLDEIGMEWKVIKNDRFDEYVEAFIQYKEKMGTCKIPSDYVNEDGLLMGQWAYRMKRNYREGKLPEEKYRKLDELGFLWNDYNGQWYKQYEKAKAFYEEYGHLSVSAKYTKEHGGTLSQWLNNQKKEYMKEDHGKLDDEQTALLESLNIELRNRKDVLFMKGLAALKKYADEYGDTLVPRDYVSKEGYHLGNWVRHIKDKYKNGKLTDKQLLSLNEIPMCFESIEVIRARRYWDTMYEEARKYHKEHGNLNVPDKYETENGRKLYNWIAQQRRIRKGTVKHSIELTEERISKLDALGMNWGK